MDLPQFSIQFKKKKKKEKLRKEMDEVHIVPKKKRCVL